MVLIRTVTAVILLLLSVRQDPFSSVIQGLQELRTSAFASRETKRVLRTGQGWERALTKHSPQRKYAVTALIMTVTALILLLLSLRQDPFSSVIQGLQE